jgi:asparagine synthase (glutamine-hydrolysing)
MSTEDGRFTIVFNGEIYNYMKLRRRLEARGRQFLTDSDTEVIMRLYAEHGKDAVAMLNGIFAFAVYDSKTGTMFIARDRMGVKPLYYTHNSEGLAFASEIKALFYSGLVRPSCNSGAVAEYFVFRHIAGEQTLFNGVLSLPPAHMLVFEKGRINISRYWSFYDSADSALGFTEAADELDVRLQAAVERQLMSDVPLGTFCSGGIDSSLITAYAARCTSDPVNTYSVGFHEKAYDETSYARMVAGAYKTHHHELSLDSMDFVRNLPRLIWHNDEPLNFPNSVQIYAISQLAKKRVTVVLTGEGADELFAGYPRYFIPWLLRPVSRMPGPLRKLSSGLLGIWRDHRLQKLSLYADSDPSDLFIYNSAVNEPNIIKALISSFFPEGFEYREKIFRKTALKDTVNRLSIMDQQTYLLSILNRQDKMSMAASVEARVPFLDNKIVEFSNSLPASHKMRFPFRKRILMAVAHRYLPREVVKRRKSGFGVPLKEWFRGDAFCQYLPDMAGSPELREYFDPSVLRQIIDGHRKGAGDYSEFLWSALNFMLWRRCFNV